MASDLLLLFVGAVLGFLAALGQQEWSQRRRAQRIRVALLLEVQALRQKLEADHKSLWEAFHAQTLKRSLIRARYGRDLYEAYLSDLNLLPVSQIQRLAHLYRYLEEVQEAQEEVNAESAADRSVDVWRELIHRRYLPVLASARDAAQAAEGEIAG